MQHATLHMNRRPQGFNTTRVRGRKLAVSVQARRNSAEASPEILTAFFYGRALAITINRRLSEAVVDFVSDVSKAMAERPQRISEFQEEVVALARKEMSGSGLLPPHTATASGPTSSSGSKPGSAGLGGSAPAAPRDPEAAVDDLRAEIAYARAALNELRATQKRSSSSPSPSSPGSTTAAAASAQQ